MKMCDSAVGTWLIPSIDQKETDKDEVLSKLYGGEYKSAVAVSLKRDDGTRATLGFVLLTKDELLDNYSNSDDLIKDIIERNTFLRDNGDDEFNIDLEDFNDAGRIDTNYFHLTDTNSADRLSDIVDSMYIGYNAQPNKVQIIWAQKFDDGQSFKKAVEKEFKKAKKVAQIVRLPEKDDCVESDSNYIGFAIFNQGYNWQNSSYPESAFKYSDVVIAEDSTYANTDFSVDDLLSSVLEDKMYDPDEFSDCNGELKFYEYLKEINSNFEDLVEENVVNENNDESETNGEESIEEAVETKPTVQHIVTDEYKKNQVRQQAVIRIPPKKATTPNQTLNNNSKKEDVIMTNLFAKFKFQPMSAAVTIDGLVAIDVNNDPKDEPKYKAIDSDNNIIEVLPETVIMEMPLLMPVMGGKPEIGDYVKQDNTWFKIIEEDTAINLNNGTITGLRMSYTQFFKNGVFHRLMIDPSTFLGNGLGMAMMLGGKLGSNGESGIDMKTLALMSMMQNQNGGAANNAFGNMNPMMMLMLMGGEKAGSGFDTQTLMLMSMMGGNNLFGNFLAPAAPAAKAPKAAKK